MDSLLVFAKSIIRSHSAFWCSYAEGPHNVFFSSSILSNMYIPVSTYNQPFSVNSSVNCLLESLIKSIFFCRCSSLLGCNISVL